MSAETELESQIGQWRGYVERHQAIAATDADEMEDHLRDQISDLSAVGLHDDEAFLVAVKRLGTVDVISREFAREHSDRLWKQLVLMPTDENSRGRLANRELIVVIGLAVLAAITVKITAWGVGSDHVFVRNAGLCVLPFLTMYFVWKRSMPLRAGVLAVPPFFLAAVLVNVFPFDAGGVTEVIVAIHVPIVLWFVVGYAYAGGRWRSDRRRMDFIRFTGEWFVYVTLLALGGGVLTALTVGAFDALGFQPEAFVEAWVLPFGPPVAVLVAAWLVEAKQSVVENIAPVLTRVFTPITVIMLLALLVAIVANGSITDIDRGLLILVDMILVLVLGLLLYSISARDPHLRPELFDRVQVVLVVSALAVDVVMLATMSSRIAEFGFTANKVVALGLNMVLFVNLLWSAVLLVGFVRGRRGFDATERWQTRYLPVFGLWAGLVVVAIPPLFDFA